MEVEVPVPRCDNSKNYINKGTICYAANCPNRSYGPSVQLSFFRFPKDKNRCHKWVINSRREDLHVVFKKDYTKLLKYRLCEQHFDGSQFKNSKRKRFLLKCCPIWC